MFSGGISSQPAGGANRVYWILLSAASVIALVFLGWGIMKTDDISEDVSDRTEILKQELLEE